MLIETVRWFEEGRLVSITFGMHQLQFKRELKTENILGNTMCCNANQPLFDLLKSCPEMLGVGVGMEKMPLDASSFVAGASPFLLFSILAGT